MKLLLLLPLLLCSGCVAYVKELHSGPYPLIHEEHETVLGIDVGYQQYTLKLGLIRHHDLYVPCCTNQIFTVPFDDTFSLGQSWTDTSVKESTVMGWKDKPPDARFARFFDPHQNLKELTNGPALKP